MIDEPLSVESLDGQYHAANKNHAATWLQTPPTQMPWGMPLANQPAIMRFTGEAGLPVPNPLCYTNPAFDMGQMAMKRFGPSKRKIFEGFDPEPEMPPTKQLITEEKIAANFDGLHISNDYTAHQCGTVNSTELPGNSVQQTTDENRMPTLVLCEELRRLTAEAVLPPTVMTRIERPTNALVLWQPPSGALGVRLQQIVDACRGSNTQNQSSSKFPSTTWNPVDNNNSSTAEDLNENKTKKNGESSTDQLEDVMET